MDTFVAQFKLDSEAKKLEEISDANKRKGNSSITSFFRKKFVNTPVRKIVETAMFGTMTVSTMYLLVTFGCSCKPLPDED